MNPIKLSSALTCLAVATLSLTALSPAHAARQGNGVTLNGTSFNGLSFNGTTLNGSSPKAESEALNGIRLRDAVIKVQVQPAR